MIVQVLGVDNSTPLSTLNANLSTSQASLTSLEQEVSGLINNALTTTDATWSSSQIVSYVTSQIADVVGIAPADLDTIGELANALSNNASFGADALADIASNTAAIDNNTTSITASQAGVLDNATAIAASLEAINLLSWRPAEPAIDATYTLRRLAGSWEYLAQFARVLGSAYTWNSDALTTVTDGTMPWSWDVEAGQVWQVDGFLFGSNFNATADVKAQLLAPAGSNGRLQIESVEQATSVGSAINMPTGSLAVASAADGLQIKGAFFAAGSGPCELQVANGVAGTTNTQTFAVGSYLVARRVA